jgi:hypothetical protein
MSEDTTSSDASRPELNGPKPTAAEPLKPKDGWDKADIVGKLLGAIAIPIGVAVVGVSANIILQDRAAKQKTDEIAITILQSKDPGIPALKAWALGVFNEMARAASHELPAEAQPELCTLLPSASVRNLELEDATARRDARLKLAESGPAAIPAIACLLAANRKTPNYRQILGAIVALSDIPPEVRCDAYRTTPGLEDDVQKHGGINETAMNKAVTAALACH